VVYNPNRGVELCGLLVRTRGFTDLHCEVVHHRGVGQTIKSFVRYCERTDAFQPGGTNETFLKRLEYILVHDGELMVVCHNSVKAFPITADQDAA
jgi:hypothetical protein